MNVGPVKELRNSFSWHIVHVGLQSEISVVGEKHNIAV